MQNTTQSRELGLVRGNKRNGRGRHFHRPTNQRRFLTRDDHWYVSPIASAILKTYKRLPASVVESLQHFGTNRRMHWTRAQKLIAQLKQHAPEMLLRRLLITAADHDFRVRRDKQDEQSIRVWHADGPNYIKRQAATERPVGSLVYA